MTMTNGQVKESRELIEWAYRRSAQIGWENPDGVLMNDLAGLAEYLLDDRAAADSYPEWDSDESKAMIWAEGDMHQWVMFHGYPSCRFCLVVRRRNGGSDGKLCRGPVKLGLR